MTRKPATTLPDLEDDAAFRAKMQPLLKQTLPQGRMSGDAEKYNSGLPVDRKSGLLQAAYEQEQIETTRGPKQRFEYVIPQRVGRALAEDAASRGVSATTRLLEVLRDAGYPVIREDLVDLRKMRRR